MDVVICVCIGRRVGRYDGKGLHASIWKGRIRPHDQLQYLAIRLYFGSPLLLRELGRNSETRALKPSDVLALFYKTLVVYVRIVAYLSGIT